MTNRVADVIHAILCLLGLALVVLAWMKEGPRFAILLVGFMIVIGVIPVALLRYSRSRRQKKNRR